MKNNELVKGMYVKEGDVEWVKFRMEFDVKEFSQMLINHKDVFDANKGKGRIDVCLSKSGKLYGSLSTYKPQQKTTHNEHMKSRELESVTKTHLEETDLPF